MKNKDAITQAIVYLLSNQRFYAELLLTMRRFDDKITPIAGVCIKNDIELHINGDVFEKYSIKERAAILAHECEHILRNHIPRGKELAPEIFEKAKAFEDSIINSQKFKTFNLAADCAVNSHVNNLPEGCIYPKLFDLQDGQTMEWYLANLKNNSKARECTDIGDHSIWSESEGDKEVIKEKIRQMVNSAATKTRGAGCMTNSDELLVSDLNKSLVNWREQLRNFVSRNIETNIESSRKKRNRRYGILFPGDVKVETLHIGVAIDTSGSISDKSLKQFLSEINSIAKYAKVTVVEADSEVKNSYEYKPNKAYKITGRGGTAYQPAFTYFSDNTEIDALIYFGDMDTSDAVTKPKYPVLWAIVGPSAPPANFGNIIRIK